MEIDFEKKLKHFETAIESLHTQLKKQNRTIETLMQPRQPTPKQLAMAAQLKAEHERAKKAKPRVISKPGSKVFAKHVVSEDGSVSIMSSVAAITPTHYYLFPWAISGDVTPVPNTVEDTVNYPNGWTSPYSLPYPTDPDALAVTRTAWNQAMLDVTLNVQEYQQWGTPNFISTSDNGGTPFPYSYLARTLYDDGVNGPRTFISKTNTNTTLPSNAGAISADWFLDDIAALRIVTDNATFEGTVVNGNAVYFNGTEFVKAVANGTAAQNVVGFADVSNKRVITFGEFDLLTGLTPGATYYLSSVTPGAISVIQSSFSVGQALSATRISVAIESSTVPGSISVVTRVHPTSGQSITSGGVVVQYNVVDFDATGAFNLTNYRFNPQVAGYYRILAQIGYAGYGPANYTNNLRKNGTITSTTGSDLNDNTGGDLTSTVEDIIQLNGTTDYVDVFATSNGTQGSSADPTLTFFIAQLITN